MDIHVDFLDEAKKVTMTFGRMNPISVGHEKLANKVMKIANSKNSEPRIYLSHTQNSKKDPLNYDKKISYAKQAFGAAVKKSKDKNIVSILKALEKEGVEDVIMVVGSDRVNAFRTFVNKYNGKDFTFNTIKIVSAGARDPDASGVEGMSGTKLRSLAAKGDEKTFSSGLASKLSSSQKKKMYKDVRSGMKIKEEVELDELAWYSKALAKISQMAHPKGYEKIVKAYADGMKNKDHYNHPSSWASDLARQHDIAPRSLIMYINKLVQKGALPKELQAGDYQFDHLADWVDVEEKRKEILKNGLLAFLKKHEEKELQENRMKELHDYIAKGMSAADIAKKMELDLKTIKALMDDPDLDNVTDDEIDDFIDDADPEDLDPDAEDDVEVADVIFPDDEDEIENGDDEEDEEEVNEIYDALLNERVLNFQQRQKIAMRMKRLAPRMARIRKIRAKRMASPEKLKFRARKGAMSLIRKKVAGEEGLKYSSLSRATKIAIDRKIEKRYPGQKLRKMVDAFSRKILPKMRKKETARIKALRAKKESFDMTDTDTSFENFIINEQFEEFVEARGRKSAYADQGDAGDDNIIYQMRKVLALRGQFTTKFQDGSSAKVSEKDARKVLNMYSKVRLPKEKQAMIKRMMKSKKNFEAELAGKPNIPLTRKQVLTKHMRKEEVEVDEISKRTKQKYLDKAVPDHHKMFTGKKAATKNKMDRRRAAIQKVSKAVKGKRHYADYDSKTKQYSREDRDIEWLDEASGAGVNHRTLASKGLIHKSMAGHQFMKRGQNSDFYAQGTGDKISGVIRRNDGKWVHVQADDPRTGKVGVGKMHKFKVTRHAGEDVEVWDKPMPDSKKQGKLSSAQKAKAKARAQKAGRPYPNMVDNMWASNESIKEKLDKSNPNYWKKGAPPPPKNPRRRPPIKGRNVNIKEDVDIDESFELFLEYPHGVSTDHPVAVPTSHIAPVSSALVGNDEDPSDRDSKRKVDTLLRLGLVPRDELQKYRRALRDKDAALKSPELRAKVGNLLDRLLKISTSDKAIYSKLRMKAGEKDVKEAETALDRRHERQKDALAIRHARQKAAADVRGVRKKAMESLERKSKDSGIPFDILEKVFDREEDLNRGFERVNSFIAGGKAREIDSDLLEVMTPQRKLQKFMDRPFGPKDRASGSSDKPKSSGFVRMKKKGQMTIMNVPSDQVGKYKEKGYYPVQEKLNNAGEEGTDKLTNRYKKDTPGQTEGHTLAFDYVMKPRIAPTAREIVMQESQPNKFTSETVLITRMNKDGEVKEMRCPKDKVQEYLARGWKRKSD